jgi:hypothetical protein
MNTAVEYSTRVVQEGGRRCKKSTLNDLVHLTPLRIPLMNPPQINIGDLAPYLTYGRKHIADFAAAILGTNLVAKGESHTIDLPI